MSHDAWQNNITQPTVTKWEHLGFTSGDILVQVVSIGWFICSPTQ